MGVSRSIKGGSQILAANLDPDPVPSCQTMACLGEKKMVWQALAEMAATKAAADQEQAVFEAEWKQLTQIIERDRQQRVGAIQTLPES